jgi:hypothetical protein
MQRHGRTKLLMVISGMCLGVLLLTPAGAHVTGSFRHLWRDHIKPRLASRGTLNASGNPVNWTKLKNVPKGLADGDDAVGPRGPEGLLSTFDDVRGLSCTRQGRTGSIHIFYADDGNAPLACLYNAAIGEISPTAWEMGAGGVSPGGHLY